MAKLSLYMYILKLYLSNLVETLMLNFENMQNTLKLKINQMPVSFCKYPRNESSDLHEILCGGQIS